MTIRSELLQFIDEAQSLRPSIVPPNNGGIKRYPPLKDIIEGLIQEGYLKKPIYKIHLDDKCVMECRDCGFSYRSGMVIFLRPSKEDYL